MANSMKGFLFYRSYFEAIRNLPDADRLALYDAIAFYSLEDVEPVFEQSYCEAIFTLIRPNIEANRKHYESGKKAKHKQPESKPEAKPVKETKTTTTTTTKTTTNRESIVRFAPPTKEQVDEYCTEKDIAIDAERFIDHYESNGWMVGRNKMKDWKAAVRNWAKRDADRKPKEKHANSFDTDSFKARTSGPVPVYSAERSKS